MNNTVLVILLVPITMILVASAYNFFYLAALIKILPHIDSRRLLPYILRLATLQPDVAGEMVEPSGKDLHAVVVQRYNRGLAMTLAAIAAMVVALLVITYGETAGWWVLKKAAFVVPQIQLS